MSRPKLLAMMRLVDDDRSGSIGFREFKQFAQCCIEEHGKELALQQQQRQPGGGGGGAAERVNSRDSHSHSAGGKSEDTHNPLVVRESNIANARIASI